MKKTRSRTKPKPFQSEMAEEDLRLVTDGKMRMPKTALDVDELFKIPTGRVAGNEAIQAVLDEREEGL